MVLQPNAIVNQEDEEDTPEDEIARAMLFRFFLVHTILQRQLVQQNSEPQEDINVNEIASLRPN